MTPQFCSHPTRADDEMCDGWHGEITHDGHQKEYHIRCVRRPKAGLPRRRHLANVEFDHLLLDLRNQRPEEIRHRQPKEYMDIVREPMAEASLKTRVNRKSQRERSENGEHDQVEGPNGIDAKRRRLE